jgi:cell wall-associated NlpC family hydrolase
VPGRVPEEPQLGPTAAGSVPPVQVEPPGAIPEELTPTGLPERSEVDPDPNQFEMLTFDPEVGRIVHDAVVAGWGPEQTTAALRNTGAYAEASQRRATFADPATAEGARAELAGQVATMFGLFPDDPQVLDYTDRLAAGRATVAGLQSLVAPMVQPTSPAQVLQVAAEHGIPMSAHTAAAYTKMDPQAVSEQLAGVSQQLYPWLKASGLSYAQATGIFRDIHTAELGREPTPDDPNFEDMIARSFGQPGVFRKQLRQLPEWTKTPRGKAMIDQRAAEATASLLSGEMFSEEPDADPYAELAAQVGQGDAGTGLAGDEPSVTGGRTRPAPVGMDFSATAFGDAGGAGNLDVIAQARRYLGTPYRWGGADPRSGLDCSGYVMRVFASMGVRLPHSSFAQARMGQRVGSLGEAQPGDLVFWDHGGGHGHIGIYAGNGYFYNAPHTGDVVRLSRIRYRPTAIRRLI